MQCQNVPKEINSSGLVPAVPEQFLSIQISKCSLSLTLSAGMQLVKMFRKLTCSYIERHVYLLDHACVTLMQPLHQLATGPLLATAYQLPSSNSKHCCMCMFWCDHLRFQDLLVMCFRSWSSTSLQCSCCFTPNRMSLGKIFLSPCMRAVSKQTHSMQPVA